MSERQNTSRLIGDPVTELQKREAVDLSDNAIKAAWIIAEQAKL